MKRSQLKNIINKSRVISNKQQVGEPFDQFKKSLPIEINDNYRLEAAWKAYGKPKNYQEALWQGLIQPIDENNVKLPSIGYDEESDTYEYLNSGRENDIVAKDIRVWDNDVIPLVKELKLGGFIRTFDEEKNCWTYSKNKPQETQSFKQGGQVKDLKTYKDFIKYIVDTDRNGGHYDYEGFWNDENVRNEWIEEENQASGKAHFPDTYKLPTHPTFSTDSKYSNSVTEGGTWSKDSNGNQTFTTSPYVEARSSLEDMQRYFREQEPGVTLIYKGVPYFTPQAFKQGGQMNVIPEGALHARKNNMEGAGKDFTAKGIPVMSNDGEQVAEIEKNEIVFNKEVTDFIEENYKKFYLDEVSSSEKDELAIKVGKRLVKEILENTDDRTGLIEEVADKNNLEYSK